MHWLNAFLPCRHAVCCSSNLARKVIYMPGKVACWYHNHLWLTGNNHWVVLRWQTLCWCWGLRGMLRNIKVTQRPPTWASLNAQTMRQTGYCSRRPHRVPLVSAGNRKLRLQFAQVHPNWTIEDWKNIPRLMSFCCDIWMVGSTNMEASTLPSINGSGCCWQLNLVRDIFLAHFGLLSTN